MIFGEGWLGARRIAARRFDFDNVHPQVVQQLAAERPHGRSQIEDPVAGEERSCVVCVSHVRFASALVKSVTVEDKGSRIEDSHPQSSISNPQLWFLIIC